MRGVYTETVRISASQALPNFYVVCPLTHARCCDSRLRNLVTVFLFSKSAEATCDELLLEKLHNMKKSIILSWAFSIIALTLVSCTSTSGTNTTTTGQTAAQTTAQISRRAAAMPPPTQSSMGGR